MPNAFFDKIAGRDLLPSVASSLAAFRSHPNIMQSIRRQPILVFLAVVALTRSLFVICTYSNSPEYDMFRKINEGSQTVTIYITDTNNYQEGLNPADSIFFTDTLERYGTGKVQYIINTNADCQCGDTSEIMQPQTPCLAVARHGQVDCLIDAIKCRYPQCKTFLTNDEECIHRMGYEGRQYHSSALPNRAYLPLGPRLENWEALRHFGSQSAYSSSDSDNDSPLSSQLLTVPPASHRKYAYNAIFSQANNSGREHLSEIINNNKSRNKKLPTFVQISPKWKTPMKNSNNYMKVLLDSTFTFAPTGRNPECFRLFEAVEAGMCCVNIFPGN